MNILDKIVAQKQLEVAASKKLISIEELKDNAFFSRKTLSLKESVKIKAALLPNLKGNLLLKALSMISKIHSLLSHLMKNMEQVVFLFLQIENSSEDQKKIY